MRRKIVAGNWKMNLNRAEAIALISELNLAVTSENVDVILFPPFIYLSDCDEILENSCIDFGAQNVSDKANGAYTGEISASMLTSYSAKYCLVGHSERREYFSENGNIISEKVQQLLSENITPIYCCGESLAVRKNGSHLEFVANQIKEELFHLSPIDFNRLIIAYEPIWAIGTGEVASPVQAQEVHQSIRMVVADKYGESISENLSILYGGSCKPNNAKGIFEKEDIDGGLIGGAALKSEDFLAIINSF